MAVEDINGPLETVDSCMQAIRDILTASERSSVEDDALTERLGHLRWIVSSRFEDGRERSGPVASTLAHAGNYWCCSILLLLQHGPLRPSAIFRILQAMEPRNPISQRMLTLNLREMERDGLVAREVHSTYRAHVEYSLLPEGLELSQRMTGLVEWITSIAPHIRKSRQNFDAARDSDTEA